jgi:hypothetical protein
VGRSSLRMRTARNHAKQAATAVWRIGSHPPQERMAAECRRTRAEATVPSRRDVPSRVSSLRSFSSLPGDARPAEPEFPLFLPDLSALLALLHAYLLVLARLRLPLGLVPFLFRACVPLVGIAL